jgi:hypothetical protein
MSSSLHSELYDPETVSAAVVALLLITGAMIPAVGLGVGVAEAKTGEIRAVSLTNTVDNDADGNFSDFDLNVTANATLIGWDKTLNPTDPRGEPRFRIKLTGELSFAR